MQDHLKPDKVEIYNLLLKSRHVDPDYSELQNYMDTFHNTFIKQLVEEGEDYLFRQFERHGYSRDEVLSLVREGRIQAYHGGEYTRYILDDEPLFEIILTHGVLDGCRYGRVYQCYDLKEVKENG